MTLEAYINEGEKINIDSHLLLDCSILDWRKDSAYVLVLYLNPIECVFICSHFEFILKEHNI